MGGFAAGFVAEKIAVAAGVTSSGGVFAIAVVAATVFDFGVTYSFDERGDSYLCKHAKNEGAWVCSGGKCS